MTTEHRELKLHARAEDTESAATEPVDPHEALATPSPPRIARPPAGLADTSLSLNIPRGPDLPFARSAAAAPRPFAQPLEGRGEPPPLTLERYASLCIDLATAPAKRTEILGRYQISEEQHRRVGAYWQARIPADATVWIAWERACAVYRGWLIQGSQSSAPPGQGAPVLERSDPLPTSPQAAQRSSDHDLRETSAPGDPPKPAFSVSTGDITLPLKAALPFENAPPEPRASRSSGKFELEQYAALCAELDAYPDDRAFVRGRYGIGAEEALQRIQQQFEDQFRTDPGLRDRWARLRAAWLAGLPGAKGR